MDLVYFDSGIKASFYCILRDRWKNERKSLHACIWLFA